MNWDDVLKQLDEQEQPQQQRPPVQVDPNDPLLNPTFGQELAAIGGSLGPSLGAAALNAFQAPTLGWGDELIGMFPGGERVNQFREERNQAYPAAGLLAEGGAGLLTGALAGPAVAGRIAGLGMSPAGTVLADAAAAGASAAAYGAGSGEPGNRLEPAAWQGAFGTVLGPLVGAAGKVGSAAFDPLGDWMKTMFRGPESQASRSIGGRMVREGVPVDEAATAARQAAVDVPEGQSPFINADTDPVQAQQLKEMYDQNPSSRQLVEDTLIPRQRNAPARVVGDIADVTGLPRDTRVMQAELLSNSKREMAKAGYGELQDQTIPISNEMLDMFTGPEAKDMRRAYMNAEAIAAREGNPIPSYNQVFGEDGTLQELPLHALDYMQRAFRNAGKPNIANPNYDNISWRKLRDRFLTEVDNASPEFKQVRRNYATASSLEEAARQGKDIYKMGDARDIADFMETLSAQEQAAFRRGAIDAVENQIRNMGAKSGNIDTRLAGTMNKDEILDIVFGPQADSVRQILQREDSFNRTFSQILGGSATSKNLGGAEGIAAPFLKGQGPGEMAMGQISRTLGTAFEPPPAVLAATVEQLMARGYTREQARQIARQSLPGGAEQARRTGQAAGAGATLAIDPLRNYFFGE